MVEWIKIVGVGGIGLVLGVLLDRAISDRKVGTGVIVVPNGPAGYPFVANVYGMDFLKNNPERGIARWGISGNSRAEAMYGVANTLKRNPGMVAP